MNCRVPGEIVCARSGLWYSHFSLMPHTLAADVARVNDVDLYGYRSRRGRTLRAAFVRLASWSRYPDTFPYYEGDVKDLHGVTCCSDFEILNGRWPNGDARTLLELHRPMTASHAVPAITFTHGGLPLDSERPGPAQFPGHVNPSWAMLRLDPRVPIPQSVRMHETFLEGVVMNGTQLVSTPGRVRLSPFAGQTALNAGGRLNTASVRPVTRACELLVTCVTALLVALPALPICGHAADSAETDDQDEAYRQMELLTEALIHVRKHYVEEKGFKEIVHGALRGMLYSLDPHSGFLDPDDYQEIRDSTSGKFGGVGVQVGVRGGLLTIIAPIEDSPGFRAGLQAGDRILEIDNEKTQGFSLSECVKRMRGDEGQEVTLVVQGVEDEKPRRVVVKREIIKVSSVKGARLIRDDIGYVRLAAFDEGTAGFLQQALDDLLAQGMAALVLDLRNNPGGLLRSSVDVASKFLKRGKVIVTRRGRAGTQAPVTDKAHGDVHLVDFPIVVLVNGGSASASEIVAGALQDHKRAVIVGSTTYGKASVQSVIKLRSGKEGEECAIRLTTAHYYTPNGREIHDRGIEPDIFVPVSPSEWRDIQIRRAHLETPAAFSDEEKAEYAGIKDHELSRAVDLLEALKIYQERRK